MSLHALSPVVSSFLVKTQRKSSLQSQAIYLQRAAFLSNFDHQKGFSEKLFLPFLVLNKKLDVGCATRMPGSLVKLTCLGSIYRFAFFSTTLAGLVRIRSLLFCEHLFLLHMFCLYRQQGQFFVLIRECSTNFLYFYFRHAFTFLFFILRNELFFLFRDYCGAFVRISNPRYSIGRVMRIGLFFFRYSFNSTFVPLLFTFIFNHRSFTDAQLFLVLNNFKELFLLNTFLQKFKSDSDIASVLSAYLQQLVLPEVFVMRGSSLLPDLHVKNSLFLPGSSLNILKHTSFEFFLHKFAGQLLKKGFLVKTVNIFFNIFSILKYNNISVRTSSNTYVFFSDAFLDKLPNLVLKVSSSKGRNVRQRFAPKLCYMVRRYPVAFKMFLSNVQKHFSYNIVAAMLFELSELLNLRGATFKAFQELYKISLTNLQFSPLILRNFKFEFLNRIDPSLVKKKRKRFRFSNSIYFC